jgi:hypothetical protein
MQERWHLYGTDAEGRYLFGPSIADDTTARALGTPDRPYVSSFDHEPGEDEITKAFG